MVNTTSYGYSTDSGEESERERCRKNVLGKLARRRFEAMLRAMSGKRGELARCMAFSLEHAEAAADVGDRRPSLLSSIIDSIPLQVADIIVSSLVVDGTPVPRKVARLHLICDILHNSAVSLPGAWRYRTEFQARLGLVFDHLSTIYHSFPGRMTADIFKGQVAAVVDVWDDWIVFPPEFTKELRQRLEGEVVQERKEEDTDIGQAMTEEREEPQFMSKFKASSFKPAEEVEPKADDGGGQDMDMDGEPMDMGSDVDGEPMDDVDGVPVDDVDGEPIDDVDGEPVDLDGEPIDDIDGVPLDDDLDGAPVAI